MNKALLSSVKMDWRTPKDFFRELDQEFHFGLDAAASPENAKCERYFTPNGWVILFVERVWGCVLQSAIWPGDREMGSKGIF